MLVDLDRWLQDEGERESSGRICPHDLFISHRRFDLPTALVESLSASGVRVVWDCDLDLRDRRVMQGVARAMRRARFIALYVSDGYIDSPWCRAEYLNALWVEERCKISRAVVICASDQALGRVPECLRAVSRFSLNDSGLHQLTDFVVTGNRLLGSGAVQRRFRSAPPERLAQAEDVLSLDERLNLLEQRLLFWAERGLSAINRSQIERSTEALATLMSDAITEPEVIFREVQKMVYDSGALGRRREGVGAQELNRVVGMADCVAACYSVPEKSAELSGLDKWAYDFLLKPLLLAVEVKATRSAAVAAYRAVCSALAGGPFGHEVPVYLDVLDVVESDREDVASALASHRLKLYEAQVNRNGA